MIDKIGGWLLVAWFAVCDVLYALAWVGAIILLIGLLLEIEPGPFFQP